MIPVILFLLIDLEDNLDLDGLYDATEDRILLPIIQIIFYAFNILTLILNKAPGNILYLSALLLIPIIFYIIHPYLHINAVFKKWCLYLCTMLSGFISIYVATISFMTPTWYSLTAHHTLSGVFSTMIGLIFIGECFSINSHK